MSVLFVLKWFYQDVVGVNVEIQHDVVVAAAEAQWGYPHIISVNLDDGIHPDEQFLLFNRGQWGITGRAE